MIADDSLKNLQYQALTIAIKATGHNGRVVDIARREFARLIAERCAEECDREKIRFRGLGLHAESISALYCRDRIRALIPTDKEN